jgi:hypothetical protein
MLLITPNEGWVFGSVEPDGSPNSFFVTRDGARSWQQFSAMRPSQLDGDKEWHEVSILPPGVSEETNCEVYRLPVFQVPTNGFFAEDCADETVDTRQISEHTTVLFVTHDGGRTWTADRTLRNFLGLCDSGDRSRFRLDSSCYAGRSAQAASRWCRRNARCRRR